MKENYIFTLCLSQFLYTLHTIKTEIDKKGDQKRPFIAFVWAMEKFVNRQMWPRLNSLLKITKMLLSLNYWHYRTFCKDSGCVHMGWNHVPKHVSDRDPKRDWDRDLNYTCVHMHCKSSQSRSGSAHCEVIFCSYCAVRAHWPMHGFSAHFQNAHARITFRKSFAS